MSVERAAEKAVMNSIRRTRDVTILAGLVALGTHAAGSELDASELLEYPGETDITASVDVGGFRMAGEDQEKFEKLQSAQLGREVPHRRRIARRADRISISFPGS